MYKISRVLGCNQKIIIALIKKLCYLHNRLVTYLAALNLFHKYYLHHITNLPYFIKLYLPRPLFLSDGETSSFR